MKIFHITHTDIRSDNRILKELTALSGVDSYKVYGAGVSMDEGAAASKQDQLFDMIAFDLWTGHLGWLPRPLRYALIMTELTLRSVYKGIRISPKVVHCHDSLVLAAGVLIKLLTGGKLVYDAHELESNKNAQTPILSKSTLFLEKICWRYVDHFITVSPSIIDWYNENLGEKPSSLILNSPVIQTDSVEDDCNVAMYSKGYFNDRYDIPSDRLIYIYLGLLVQGRGIEDIVSVFKKSDLKSHVIFVGYGDMTEEIGEISSNYTNIHLHEPVPHENVVSLVRNADIGLCLIENVSLSDYYCLPNKLFEYGFAGIFVLGSRFPDIESTIQKYQLGYCCDNDVQSIENVVREIEAEGISTKEMADLTELSWQAQAERLLHLYAGILKR